MSQWKTRCTIIERAKDPNDEFAWQDFVKYYEGYIAIVLIKMGFNGHDIDDLRQEILVKIWKYLNKFDTHSGQAQFRRWLSVIIRNHSINWIRSEKNHKKRELKAVESYCLETEEATANLNGVMQDEWEFHLAKTALEKIRPLFLGCAVEAFELYIEGKTTREISEMLDIKHNSVLTLVNRVRIKLSDEVIKLQELLEFK